MFKLNAAQVQVLAVGFCFLLLACLVVPWYLPASVDPHVPYSVTLRSFRFAPFFAPPLAGAAVDVARLSLELLMVAAVTACFVMFAHAEHAKTLRIPIACLAAGALSLLTAAIVYSTAHQANPLPVAPGELSGSRGQQK